LRPQTLVKTKVVKMDPAPPPEEEVPKIEKDAVFTINENFRSKKQKVNINIPMRREKEEENEETHKAVEEDRKLQIQVNNSILFVLICIRIYL
jgi:cullin 1